MEFREVVRKRRMVRHFTSEPVPAEVVDRIIATAQHAPSAGFSQGIVFVAVTDEATRKRIGEIAGEEHYVKDGFHPFISQAPVQIVICASEQVYHDRYREPDKKPEDADEIDWPVPYWHTDAGCALMLILLAAVNEGLGSAFVGTHHPDQVQALLGIPAEYLPIGVAMIGHAAPDVPSPSLKRGRRQLDDVLHRERW
jgi:nitroreductase